MQRISIALGLVLVLFLSVVLNPYPALAQDGGGGEDAPTQYIVKEGDNLYNIALQFGVTIEAIAAANNIENPRLIYAGQLLTIPVNPMLMATTTATASPTTAVPTESTTTETPSESPDIYVVQEGDNLFRIAERFGTTVQEILALNPNITTPSLIYADQQLRLRADVELSPTETEAPSTETLTPTEEPTEVSTETLSPSESPTEAIPESPSETEITVATDTPAAPVAEFGFGYGVEAFIPGLDANVVGGRIQELGVEWVKHTINWADYEATQGQIDFTEIDAIIDTLEGSGANIMLSVIGAPAWARVGLEGDFGPPADNQNYASFVGALASRYGSRVAAYEIWDEPNLQSSWAGKAVSGESYVQLLQAAYTAIKAANPSTVVVSAGLAPTGGGSGAINDRDYLRQMYEAGLMDVSDAIGAHPYGWANSPDSTCCETNPDVTEYDNHPSFFFLQTLEDYRLIMQEYGDTATFIWVTEFGWGSNENFPVEAPAGFTFVENVNLDQQAQYLERAFSIGDDLEYVGPMFAWNLNFCQSAGLQSYQCFWSMLDPLGNPRPIFNAFANISK